MANYKGVGYDSTNARVRTGTSNDEIQFAAQVTAQDGLAVTGSASVSGDLTVQGDIVSRSSSNLLVQDNFIDLNQGQSSVTPDSGGYTVQVARASTFTSKNISAFVAAVANSSGTAGGNIRFTNMPTNGVRASTQVEVNATGGTTIADGDTLTVQPADGGGAIVFTAKASGAVAPQFNIVAGNSNSTADNLRTVIQAQAKLRATVLNNVVTISQETAGTTGNTKTCQSSDTGAMFKPGASTTQPDNFAGGVNRDIALASNAAASSSVVLGILDAASTSGNPALVLGGESMVKSSNYTFNDVDLGAKVYLGTSGQLTTTAPTAAGTYVVECGIIFDNDTVLFRPVFIMENG